MISYSKIYHIIFIATIDSNKLKIGHVPLVFTRKFAIEKLQRLS